MRGACQGSQGKARLCKQRFVAAVMVRRVTDRKGNVWPGSFRQSRMGQSRKRCGLARFGAAVADRFGAASKGLARFGSRGQVCNVNASIGMMRF